MTANLQVSYRDQHGRIFVVGADTPDALFDNLLGVLGGAEAAQRVFEDFQLIADPPVQQAVTAAAPIRAGAGAPSAGAPTPSAPGAPSCPHGPRAYKEAFTSKAGRAMPSSWQCQSRDRNDQCKAQWNDA